MLSRAAENLFWLGRYMERAESTARMIAMGQRMAMLPGTPGRSEWASVLQSTGTVRPVDEQATELDVVRQLILDPESPASIQYCLLRARENGRAVRTGLTQEMWESLNEDWRFLESLDEQAARTQLTRVMEWVRKKTAYFKGAVETAMLRDEGYDFLRLGAGIERADMTLRLLNVKYFLLLPETEVVGGGRDHYQWMSMLHAVSGLRSYHRHYGSDYAPWNIADFLLLNQTFPRSVAFSYSQIDASLTRLEKFLGTTHKCQQTARHELERFDRIDISVVFNEGLHEFINEELAKTSRISTEVSDAYHFQVATRVRSTEAVGRMVPMNLHVRHRSEYLYEPKAARVSLRIKLFPSRFEGQYVRSWSVEVNGDRVEPIYVSGFGDEVALWQSDDDVASAVVIAEGVVETEDMSGVVRDLPRRPPRDVFLRHTRLTKPSEAIRELARRAAGNDALSTCHTICDVINETIAYRQQSTHSYTTAAEALDGGSGVCQDHAHVMIAACRSLDIPSRYVTGYMMAGEEDEDILETHAWAEVFVQELGWVGFDPSNALCPTDRYIRLACGLDADDAAPIKGHVIGETDISLSAVVAVVPDGQQ